ncbi:SixA phosphatase family protein [Arenicella xantha]|uniref:Phosphohistidine phosphatase n=1 Tax=Arenicella xantha TaxID=644221 RepID=A0A395JMK9_9GAMM|nr:histidine phosphatase family protein [Arenicella xantha]RBP49144.1 phosphohistidine phosphatase [Arenicella xantha]
MKTLFLIRHAKSSWQDQDLDDHERPLNKRGERDSLTMARYLAERDESIEVIYSSTAIRALDFAQNLSDFTGVTLMPDLTFYTFDVDELHEILKHLPEHVTNVAVVGHNPAITEAVNRLAAQGYDNVPTAGIVKMECDIEDWSQLYAGCAELQYFVSPKMLA